MIFEGSGLIELLMGQLIKTAISSQLSSAEHVEVDISAALGQVLQGEAKSISFYSEGLWLTSDLKIDALDLDIANLSLSLVSAIRGQLTLAKPLGLSVELTICEESLNQFINSPPIYSWIETIVFLQEQQAFSLKPRQIDIELEHGQLKLDVEAQMAYHVAAPVAPTSAIAVSGILKVLPQDAAYAQSLSESQPALVYLQEARFKPSCVPLLVETAAILSWVARLIGLRQLDREAFSTVIRSVNVSEGQLQVGLDAQVRQLDPLMVHLHGSVA